MTDSSQPADFSGLVLLLPELESIVGPWRSRFDAVPAGLGAHLTLLAPWIAPEQITAEDLDAVAQLIRSWHRFEVTFSRFGMFQNAAGPSVHWLAPEPADPLLALADDLATGWPEYPPYRGAFGAEPVPHLTIARTPPDSDLAAMVAEVTARLPITATAAEVSVIEVRGQRCSIRAAFRLGGKNR